MDTLRRAWNSSRLPACLLIAAACTATVGCRVEHAPSRVQNHEIALEKLASAPLPVPAQPDTDDASLVMAACGQPNSDTVRPIYSKFYNGPVRRMEYVGKRDVTLDFIPSRPLAELAYSEAPLPHSGNPQDSLPVNATWRFEAGFMEQEQMFTSGRLGVYLPCAGQALHHEF